MNTRYDLMEYFQKRWDDAGRKNAFTAQNIDEFKTWKESTRDTLKDIRG